MHFWLSSQPIHPLSFVGETWGTCGVDKGTCPLGDFRSRRAAGYSLPVAMDKAPPKETRWLKTSNTRHTATGTPQAPLTHEFQAPATYDSDTLG